jgi:hypothetical protein
MLITSADAEAVAEVAAPQRDEDVGDPEVA